MWARSLPGSLWCRRSNGTDRDSIPAVDRSHGVTLHWRDESGRPILTLLIIARNVDQIATTIGMTICAVPYAEAGQFTIPPALLANIPASSANSPGGSYAVNWPSPHFALRAPVQRLGPELRDCNDGVL